MARSTDKIEAEKFKRFKDLHFSAVNAGKKLTNKDISKILKIDPSTVAEYFNRLSQSDYQYYFRPYTTEILSAVLKYGKESKGGRDRELWLKFIENYTEKVEQKIEINEIPFVAVKPKNKTDTDDTN